MSIVPGIIVPEGSGTASEEISPPQLRCAAAYDESLKIRREDEMAARTFQERGSDLVVGNDREHTPTPAEMRSRTRLITDTGQAFIHNRQATTKS
jgi:hypothetical protein